jgi:hypothetical protein
MRVLFSSAIVTTEMEITTAEVAAGETGAGTPEGGGGAAREEKGE